MTRPRALVLYGDGINCQNETAYALELAGFDCELVTCLTLKEDLHKLKNECQLLALPGGFSFGDEVRSGKVLAVKMRAYMGEAIAQFCHSGKLIIGICNGFQALVQLGILPLGEVAKSDQERTVTLAHNSGGKFMDRWVDLNVSGKSAYFAGLSQLSLPVRHGEGRLVLRDEASQSTRIKALAPLRYQSDINGSFDQIAALVSPSDKVLGLMPHPECYIRHSQKPNWTRLKGDQALKQSVPGGLQIFINARAMLN